MPPDGHERRGAEWYEHEIAGVGSDARDDAEEHDDVGERTLRRRRHELADERGDETRALRDADADHDDEDDPHRGEAHEVRDERREQIADAVDGEQTLDLHRLGDDVIVVRRRSCGGQQLTRQRRPTDAVRRDRCRGRRHDLVGRADARPREQLRQHDHADAQRQEHDRRVRHLVADPLDEVEGLLEYAALGVLLGARCGGRRAHAPPPARSARRPNRSATATEVRSSSSSSTRSLGPWMLE